MAAEKLRICITVNAAWNIWNFRKPLVEALLADGHEVHVLAPSDEQARQLVAIGCDFTDLPMSRKSLNPIDGYRLRKRIGDEFDRIQPDIVLGFTIKNNLFGIPAARDRGIPFIPNVTGLGTAFLGSALLRHLTVALYRRAFRTCPIAFFQNSDDLDLFVSLGIVKRTQGRLLPGSGIDLARFVPHPPPQNEKTRFLMIARLLRDKGVLEYVEAARLLLTKGANAEFQLLGPLDTSNRTAIDAETVAGWSGEKDVNYLGTSADTRVEIAAADCVVLPSYREGAPRTLIEAASMQRPLVASNVPGCTAVVDDGINGLLCKARDATDLAAKMRTLLEMSQEEQAAMGAASRAKMQREFDVEIVIAAYREAIDELLSGKLALDSSAL